MQTIALEFKKLDKLPVPESANEILLVERADGMIRPIDVFDSMLTGKLAFNCHFSNELRYCHLKVTAATEPTFKVGDRVTIHPNFSKRGVIAKTYNRDCDVDFGFFTVRYQYSDLTLITE